MTEFNSATACILLPQALRIVLPTLTSEVMGMFKNTSVAVDHRVAGADGAGTPDQRVHVQDLPGLRCGNVPGLSGSWRFCVFVLMHWMERCLARARAPRPPSLTVAS